MPAEQIVHSYTIFDTVTVPPPRGGMRVVTRDAGRCLDVVASPSSSYLLPELTEFSLLKREARLAGASGVTIYGDQVRVDKLDDPIHGEAFAVPPGVADWGLITAPRVTPEGVQAMLQTHTTLDLALCPVVVRRPAPAPAPAETPPATDADGPLPLDAPVAAIASRIATMTELGDERLAALFKVERETFCRWRTGVLDNPRPGNRRRLGLLLSVLEDLAARGAGIRDWLLNQTTEEGLTPYELIEVGQIDDVAYLVNTMGEPLAARDPRVALGAEPEPLQFGDDDVWEPDLDDDDG